MKLPPVDQRQGRSVLDKVAQQRAITATTGYSPVSDQILMALSIPADTNWLTSVGWKSCDTHTIL